MSHSILLSSSFQTFCRQTWDLYLLLPLHFQPKENPGEKFRLRVRCGTVMRNERREREREIPTWATSMLESQLRGRTAVRSLEPSKVEMIPFWSTLRIMVASTKYMSPFLSTAIPEWGKQHKCVSWQGTGLLGWWWWWGCPTTHYLLG